ncbi:MAG: glycosyltransferase family 87 protein [Rhizomicrobium sp.]
MRPTDSEKPDSGNSDSEKRLIAAAAGIVFAYGAVALRFFANGTWIRDTQDRPLVTDFLPVFTAGKLAWAGHAATAYDWRAFHRIQADFIGHPFAGFLGWHYPPLYFLVAMALALAPYTTAFLGWVVTTLAAFAGVTGAIMGRPPRILIALALPPVLGCVLVGQNGFFTGALLGALLLCLPTRPLLAGLFLALLTFKPQFGILLPFALLAGGYWRSIAVAALLTLLWIGIGFGFSPEAFAGFLHYLPETSRTVLGEGTSGWGKLQSVYAVIRLLGGSDATGWAAQIATAALAGGYCLWLWRRPLPFALKAAALSAAMLLATPYVYFYDLPVLGVALAFLLRHRPFDGIEYAILAVIFMVLAAFVAGPMPFGLLATALVLALTIRRAA